MPSQPLAALPRRLYPLTAGIETLWQSTYSANYVTCLLIHLGRSIQSSKLLTSEGMMELNEPGMCKCQIPTTNKKDKSKTIWHHPNFHIDM